MSTASVLSAFLAKRNQLQREDILKREAELNKMGMVSEDTFPIFGKGSPISASDEKAYRIMKEATGQGVPKADIVPSTTYRGKQYYQYTSPQEEAALKLTQSQEKLYKSETYKNIMAGLTSARPYGSSGIKGYDMADMMKEIRERTDKQVDQFITNLGITTREMPQYMIDAYRQSARQRIIPQVIKDYSLSRGLNSSDLEDDAVNLLAEMGLVGDDYGISALNNFKKKTGKKGKSTVDDLADLDASMFNTTPQQQADLTDLFGKLERGEITWEEFQKGGKMSETDGEGGGKKKGEKGLVKSLYSGLTTDDPAERVRYAGRAGDLLQNIIVGGASVPVNILEFAKVLMMSPDEREHYAQTRRPTGEITEDALMKLGSVLSDPTSLLLPTNNMAGANAGMTPEVLKTIASAMAGATGAGAKSERLPPKRVGATGAGASYTEKAPMDFSKALGSGVMPPASVSGGDPVKSIMGGTDLEGDNSLIRTIYEMIYNSPTSGLPTHTYSPKMMQSLKDMLVRFKTGKGEANWLQQGGDLEDLGKQYQFDPEVFKLIMGLIARDRAGGYPKDVERRNRSANAAKAYNEAYGAEKYGTLEPYGKIAKSKGMINAMIYELLKSLGIKDPAKLELFMQEVGREGLKTYGVE